MIEEAKEKLNIIISEGKQRVSSILTQVQDEFKSREEI